jgi:P4 family phage/plasmid primase-like protien
VLPFAAPVDATQWEKTYAKLAADLGGGAVDPSWKDASRIYYFLSCPPERRNDAFVFVNDGAPLDTDDFTELERSRPPERPQSSTRPIAQAARNTATRGSKNAATALQKELDKLRAAPKGDRNNQLNRSAHALGQLVGAGVLERAHVESELTATAHGIGLNGEEMARTIQSGLTAGEREPRQLPEPRAAQIYGALKTSHITTETQSRQITADQISSPTLTNEKGNPEYEASQLVALLHPSWKVENLATHAAHAQRIRDHLGRDLCYNPNLGWLVYDGRCWQRDDKHATNTASRVATLSQNVREEGATLYRFAATLAQAGRESDAKAMSAAAALLRHTKQVESKAFIEGALYLAAGLLAVEVERFDQKPWIVGFQNGTWDKGQWREHRRDDYLLHLSPVELDFSADRSEWQRVLERITAGDADFAKMLQDVNGYILSAASHLRLLPFFYGPKGTGKSTDAELLQTILGDMSATVDPKKLQDSAARERLGADLWNRRLAVCSEAGSQRLEAELLKTLSGGDRLAVRFLFREAFTAPPRHVLLMVTNDPPQMDAYDAALKDRVITLPFVHALNNGAPLELTGGKRIEAVRQEPSSLLVRGFAAWAMEGLQRVYQTQDIHRAACSQTATAQFWADTNPITPFWETIKESELRAGITKTYLRKQYDIWCEAEGARPLNRPRWAKACESHGLLEERRGTDSTRFWFLPTQPKG